MANSKKASALSTTATAADAERFIKTDTSGKLTAIAMTDLRTQMLSSVEAASFFTSLRNMAMDGIGIMYHNINDSNYPYMCKVHEWPALQTAGQVADGVVVMTGDKCLVIAPTEATLLWSSAAISGGGTTTSDRVTAIADWNGKSNTAKQVAASTSSVITNTATYAPGYCNLYSRTNGNGKGIIAGQWWLPSIGELMCIFANRLRINYALSLISGATQLGTSWYWSSTELSSTNAWYLYLGNGYLSNWFTKASNQRRVRPVSAFVLGNYGS
jgi:hypothetical protein